MTHRPGTVAQAVIPLVAALSLALGACSTTPSATPDPTAAPTPTESEPSPTLAPSPDAGSPAPADPPADSVEVRLADSDFHPAELTIAAGTVVVFVNGDDYGHTITEGSDGRAVDDPFVDEELEQEPVSVTFDEPGTFELTCRIHPTMNMTITVEG